MAKKLEDISERKVKRKLTFKLTEEEFADKGRKAGQIGAELRKLEDEFASVKKGWSEKLTAKEEALNSLLNVIHSGEEQRDVDCTEQRDYSKNVVRYVVGGKTHEERAMTESERQLDFDNQKRPKQTVKMRDVTGTPRKKKSHAAEAQA